MSTYWNDRIRRHAIIALATLACVGLFCKLFSARRDLISLLSIATAYPALFLTAAAFLVQQWQLSRLESKWRTMAPKVKELEVMQQQIRTYRPWFDESFHSLSILRELTEAFPEDGVVSAKSVEIRDLSAVTCSGTARDMQALLKVLDQLRHSKDIGNVKVDQIRGKAPWQFTFNCQWTEGGRNEN